MYTKFFWKIIPKETPVVEKNCSRCNHNEFICSEKFRINSNKKMSDVWLIYKCLYCESTWKMDILMRKNLSQIDYELFRQFQENNVDLAWHYAFDKSIAKNNNVRINGNIKLDVVDEVGDYLQSDEKTISIIIKSKYELSISIKKILQYKLNISVNQLEKLHQEGVIVIHEEKHNDISKKIGKGCKILMDIEKLKNLEKR